MPEIGHAFLPSSADTTTRTQVSATELALPLAPHHSMSPHVSSRFTEYYLPASAANTAHHAGSADSPVQTIGTKIPMTADLGDSRAPSMIPGSASRPSTLLSRPRVADAQDSIAPNHAPTRLRSRSSTSYQSLIGGRPMVSSTVATQGAVQVPAARAAVPLPGASVSSSSVSVPVVPARADSYRLLLDHIHRPQPNPYSRPVEQGALSADGGPPPLRDPTFELAPPPGQSVFPYELDSYDIRPQAEMAATLVNCDPAADSSAAISGVGHHGHFAGSPQSYAIRPAPYTAPYPPIGTHARQSEVTAGSSPTSFTPQSGDGPVQQALAAPLPHYGGPFQGADGQVQRSVVASPIQRPRAPMPSSMNGIIFNNYYMPARSAIPTRREIYSLEDFDNSPSVNRLTHTDARHQLSSRDYHPVDSTLR